MPTTVSIKNLSHSVLNGSDLPTDIKQPHGEWEQLWVEGCTPWDLGEATPIVVHLVESGSLPNGRALIPGCGTGYDVVEMASPERHVVGLDVSKTSVERSTKMFSSLPNANQFSFVEEDFFTWEPEKFNLIFDYGFFCAFEPKVRPLWAKRMDELLKPGGELITMIFPLGDRYGGPPPWPVTVSDYEELLIPLGFEVISIVDNDLSPDSRKGMEKVGRWKKKKSV